MEKLVPEIDDEKLVELASKIKPVILHQGKLKFIKPVDLRGTAFTWDPKPVEQAVGLRKAFEMATYHTCAYYGFFKPSIAEVLAQLPEEQQNRIVAFKTEIADKPVNEVTTRDGNHHIAKTVFYTGVLPEAVRQQPVIVNGRRRPAP